MKTHAYRPFTYLTVLFYVFVGVVEFTQVGCSLGAGRQQQIIVILVDRLGATDLTCLEEQKQNSKSGFALLCRESIRFTHAYTPHTRPGPAVASVLTGKYPFQLELEHEKSFYLSASNKTLAENLFQAGWRTSFFSGGPPISRSLGIQQGFELFEDHFQIRPSQLFRPFKNMSSLYFDWLTESRKNSLAVFYVPDLTFVNHPTMNQLGEARNLSLESQMEELDQSLFEFFSQLQKRKLWDSTTLIFAGLSGRPVFTNSMFDPVDVRSETTQVSFLVKPKTERPRDESLHWSVDQNISLVDIFPTALEIATGRPKAALEPIQSQSLVTLMKINSGEFAKGRMIISEGGARLSDEVIWSSWAIRIDHLLFLKDTKLKIYNSLIDKQETSTVPYNDPIIQLDMPAVTQFLSEHEGSAESPTAKYNLTNSFKPGFWSSSKFKQTSWDFLEREFSKKKNPFYLWFALQAVQDERWKDLAELGKVYANEQWTGFAQFHLKKKWANGADPCLDFANDADNMSLKKLCRNLDHLSWLEQISGALHSERRMAATAYYQYYLDLSVFNHHRENGLIYDLSDRYLNKLIFQEMVLSLPKFAKMRSQLQKEALQLRFD